VNQEDDQDGAAVYAKAKGQPVLLAFKNLILDVEFAPHAEKQAPLDMPPTVLLAKLREMAQEAV
jgi:hypothetical protein